ncbi:MAG: hypothetical protein KGL39_50955, partial [Patescibacteria group bacterium]|nr:hypothetical protein [Patescibacteria group bacterium]
MTSKAMPDFMRRALFVYCCLLCLPSLRADDLTALTDTNGFFTWPTNLQASQVTGYTNLPFLGYNTTNNAGWTLTPNGHYTFIDNYGTTNSFTASGWEIYQTNGASLIYTNGVLALDGTNVANVAQLADDYASLSNFTFTEFGTLGANDTNNAAAASNNLAALAYTLAAAGTNNTQAA